jgi:ubiquinone/menaquinone biosynthesis C-methylase UbiE
MSDPVEPVARAYDAWAAQYDTDENATRDLDATIVRDAPLHLHDRTVLELGCGTGKNTVWLAEHARELVAMDFSEGMLAEARKRVTASHVRFVRHDVRTPWPVASGAVDVVVGNLILEHVQDLAPIFAEAARALRSGGQLFLCELHPFRQRRGSQAQFTDPATGERVRVDAFTHAVSDYLNAALAHGFVLRHLGEWLEPGAPPESPPRLLSLLLERDHYAPAPATSSTA